MFGQVLAGLVSGLAGKVFGLGDKPTHGPPNPYSNNNNTGPSSSGLKPLGLFNGIGDGFDNAVSGAMSEKVSNAFLGVPQRSNPSKLGRYEKKYMDAKYPGTTPWEQLGGSAGHSSNSAAVNNQSLEHKQQSQELKLKREELQTRKDVAKTQAEAAKYSADAQLKAAGYQYDRIPEKGTLGASTIARESSQTGLNLETLKKVQEDTKFIKQETAKSKAQEALLYIQGDKFRQEISNLQEENKLIGARVGLTEAQTELAFAQYVLTGAQTDTEFSKYALNMAQKTKTEREWALVEHQVGKTWQETRKLFYDNEFAEQLSKNAELRAELQLDNEEAKSFWPIMLRVIDQALPWGESSLNRDKFENSYEALSLIGAGGSLVKLGPKFWGFVSKEIRKSKYLRRRQADREASARSEGLNTGYQAGRTEARTEFTQTIDKVVK